MKKHVALYGIVGGLLIGALRLVEYRFLLLEHSVAIYGGAVAVLFAALGIWLGVRVAKGRERVVVHEVTREVRREVTREVFVPAPPAAPLAPGAPPSGEEFGLSPRELEILRLMAEGMTNREIAARLFVSENTVKTHSSRLFEKLGARRRTQAVQLGRRHALIP